MALGNYYVGSLNCLDDTGGTSITVSSPVGPWDFINNKNNNMLHSRIASLFKNKDTKTLERAEIQHPNGQLTGDGHELLLQLFLKKNKKEVVELAKQLIEDRK